MKTHLGRSHHEAVSHVWDEAVNVHAQISVEKDRVKRKHTLLQKQNFIYGEGRGKVSSLHLDNVSILQNDIRVTLQRGVMADAVVHRNTGRKCNAWGGNTVSYRVWDGNILEIYEKQKNTFLHVLFPLEDFSSFCNNESVPLFAKAQHGDASCGCCDYCLQGLCRKMQRENKASQSFSKLLYEVDTKQAKTDTKALKAINSKD